MWSVVEICYANDEYVREHEERERQPVSIEVLTKREEDLPSSEPLQTLVTRMRRPSPAAIDLLVELFRPPEGQGKFLKLVREYLPDMEKKILEPRDISERMYIFAVDFGSRYFPLEEDWLQSDEETGYEKIIYNAPASFHAFTQEDYDEIPNSEDTATIVLAYILENPWYHEDRAAFAEAAARYIPDKLLRMIPEEGFDLNELEESLAGTKFEPVAFWGAVICQQTGNHFFDCSYLEESGVQFNVSWDRPTIEELTRQYQAWEAWMNTWAEFRQWFDKELEKNAFNLIKILRERSKKIGKEGTESDNEDNEEPYPVNDPRQGKFFDLESDGTPMAGAADPQDTTGPA